MRSGRSWGGGVFPDISSWLHRLHPSRGCFRCSYVTFVHADGFPRSSLLFLAWISDALAFSLHFESLHVPIGKLTQTHGQRKRKCKHKCKCIQGDTKLKQYGIDSLTQCWTWTHKRIPGFTQLRVVTVLHCTCGYSQHGISLRQHY